MRSGILANGLFTVEDASSLIASGAVAVVAGTAPLLRRLPAGTWVGGTMRYFMTADGGSQTTDRVFVTELPVDAADVRIRSYRATELHEVVTDAPSNGFSFMVIPAESPAHLEYAARAPYYPGIFRTPIVGWIAGVNLHRLGHVVPRSMHGLDRRMATDTAVVLHASLPPGKVAHIDIVNMFKAGNGDVITFPSDTLAARDCRVNGEPRNLAQYVTESGIDTRLPLVADYAGIDVNTSFQGVDAAKGIVTFYAPVFHGIEYRLAEPVDDYAARFAAAVAGAGVEAAFACSCILNYVYGGLEGRKIGHLTGPMTFGEIAYQLLNQTAVYLSIVDASEPGTRQGA
jgi:hypothetical protein